MAGAAAPPSAPPALSTPQTWKQPLSPPPPASHRSPGTFLGAALPLCSLPLPVLLGVAGVPAGGGWGLQWRGQAQARWANRAGLSVWGTPAHWPLPHFHPPASWVWGGQRGSFLPARTRQICASMPARRQTPARRRLQGGGRSRPLPHQPCAGAGSCCCASPGEERGWKSAQSRVAREQIHNKMPCTYPLGPTRTRAGSPGIPAPPTSGTCLLIPPRTRPRTSSRFPGFAHHASMPLNRDAGLQVQAWPGHQVPPYPGELPMAGGVGHFSWGVDHTGFGEGRGGGLPSPARPVPALPPHSNSQPAITPDHSRFLFEDHAAHARLARTRAAACDPGQTKGAAWLRRTPCHQVQAALGSELGSKRMSRRNRVKAVQGVAVPSRRGSGRPASAPPVHLLSRRRGLGLWLGSPSRYQGSRFPRPATHARQSQQKALAIRAPSCGVEQVTAVPHAAQPARFWPELCTARGRPSQVPGQLYSLPVFIQEVDAHARKELGHQGTGVWLSKSQNNWHRGMSACLATHPRPARHRPPGHRLPTRSQSQATGAASLQHLGLSAGSVHVPGQPCPAAGGGPALLPQRCCVRPSLQWSPPGRTQRRSGAGGSAESRTPGSQGSSPGRMRGRELAFTGKTGLRATGGSRLSLQENMMP